MKYRILALATGALMLSAGAASAATVTNTVNLRAGPGTSYSVIDTLPAGADVDVLNCTGNWCRVSWDGAVGFASASYLDDAGTYEASPVYAQPIYYDYAFGGPRFYGFHRGYYGFHGFRGGFHHGGFHGGFHGGGFHGGGFHGGGHYGGHR